MGNAGATGGATAVERAGITCPSLDDRYLSLRLLAEYSGLSLRTLRGFLAHPIAPLPHYRPGGKVLIKRSEFDAWMQQFAERGTPRVSEIVDDIFRGR
jgi:excisionase family DNA binding protein